MSIFWASSRKTTKIHSCILMEREKGKNLKKGEKKKERKNWGIHHYIHKQKCIGYQSRLYTHIFYTHLKQVIRKRNHRIKVNGYKERNRHTHCIHTHVQRKEGGGTLTTCFSANK